MDMHRRREDLTVGIVIYANEPADNLVLTE